MKNGMFQKLIYNSLRPCTLDYQILKYLRKQFSVLLFYTWGYGILCWNLRSSFQYSSHIKLFSRPVPISIDFFILRNSSCSHYSECRCIPKHRPWFYFWRFLTWSKIYNLFLCLLSKRIRFFVSCFFSLSGIPTKVRPLKVKSPIRFWRHFQVSFMLCLQFPSAFILSYCF